MTRVLAVVAAIALAGCGGSAVDPVQDWKTCAAWGKKVTNATLTVPGKEVAEARCADANSTLVCRWESACVTGTSFCYFPEAPVKCWMM
jgi:hypothetical protein